MKQFGKSSKKSCAGNKCDSNDPAGSSFQDVGYDGLTDTAERRKYQ